MRGWVDGVGGVWGGIVSDTVIVHGCASAYLCAMQSVSYAHARTHECVACVLEGFLSDALVSYYISVALGISSLSTALVVIRTAAPLAASCFLYLCRMAWVMYGRWSKAHSERGYRSSTTTDLSSW